jgi:hypothetical protein
MAKILFGGIVGGIVVFLWGFVSHVFFALDEYGIKDLPNEEGLAAAFKADVPGPGLYSVPGRGMSTAPAPEKVDAYMAKVANGPYAFIVVYPRGRNVSLGRMLPIEFGTNVVCAVLAAILVSQLRPDFVVRVACVTLVGLMGALMTLVPNWNWYGFPIEFTGAQTISHVVGWFLAGIVLAAIWLPGKRAEPTSIATV